MSNSNRSANNEIEGFFCNKLPSYLKNKYSESNIVFKADENKILKTIDFQKPFLKTSKIVVFSEDKSNIVNSSSIGIGKIFPDDTEGHYNSTIYLALAGRLMPSTASIHLALFYEDKAPQAIEGKSIRLLKKAFNNGLLQPAPEGTTFFVESKVIKKKLNLLIVNTKIFFGNTEFGIIENLTFILTNKDSILGATICPEEC